MGDAGEGLIDADARIQERMDELALTRAFQRSLDFPEPSPALASAMSSEVRCGSND